MKQQHKEPVIIYGGNRRAGKYSPKIQKELPRAPSPSLWT